MPNPFLYKWTVLIQTIQFSIRIAFVNTQLNIKTVLYQVIQFSINMHFSSIWPIYRTLSGATTPCPSGPGSNDNEGVLCILQISSVIETLPWDCLVLYPGHLLGRGSYPSVKMQLVYSTAPADWAITKCKQMIIDMCNCKKIKIMQCNIRNTVMIIIICKWIQFEL